MFLKGKLQIASIIILIVTVWYSFYSLSPNTVHHNQFSVNNALHHLKNISGKPHFTGSEAHKTVKNYIVNELKKLTPNVEIQQQVSINKKWRAATNTQNIIAKIKGSENGKSLLLLSHYDSNPHSSLGASDAGSGVVVILEGIRAFLAEKKQPKNDIIICFTDAEELGLLGANAFVKHHNWASNIGVVLNFEARGSGGPSYFFIETNEGNKNLIQAFKEANFSYPIGNSLLYSIYKLLPNDTDLTVFREDGNIDGFNFAFIGDHFDYHTQQDSFERMDINSFQHQASYLIEGLNYFSNSNLNNLKSNEDYVYFNFPIVGLIAYPFLWIVPILLITILLFFALIFIGFKKNILTVKGVLIGFYVFLLSLLISLFTAYVGWKIILIANPAFHDILHGFTYNGYFYIAFFITITLVCCFWFYTKFFKKISIQDVVITPLFFWILISIAAALFLKGASFFIVAVIEMLLMLTILMFSKNKAYTHGIITVLSLPILLIFTPFLSMFPVGLGLKMITISVFFTVLLVGVLLPLIYDYQKHIDITKVFLLMSIVLFIATIFTSNFNSENKKPTSIFYIHDTETNKAFWATYNTVNDNFTQQFLGKEPLIGSFDTNTLASKYKTNIKFHKPAPITKIQAPTIFVSLDTVIQNERIINIKIASNRNANKVDIISKIPIKVKGLKVNNESLKPMHSNYIFDITNGTLLSYFITEKNETIDLEFVVDSNQIIDLDILEIKFDLLTNPLFNIKPRSEQMMPMPFVLNDATVVKTHVIF